LPSSVLGRATWRRSCGSPRRAHGSRQRPRAARPRHSTWRVPCWGGLAESDRCQRGGPGSRGSLAGPRNIVQGCGGSMGARGRAIRRSVNLALTLTLYHSWHVRVGIRRRAGKRKR
jgi:hypothetical protein